MLTRFQEFLVTFKLSPNKEQENASKQTEFKSASEQARQILDKMLELQEQGVTKIGITYSANHQQAMAIFKAYGHDWRSKRTNTHGSGQAAVIKEIEAMLSDAEYYKRAPDVLTIYDYKEGEVYKKDDFIYKENKEAKKKELYLCKGNNQFEAIDCSDNFLDKGKLNKTGQLSLSYAAAEKLFPLNRGVLDKYLQKFPKYKASLEKKFFILPISTCKYSGGEGAVSNDWLYRELNKIYDFCNLNEDSIALGWKNKKGSDFAIGGGISKKLTATQNDVIKNTLSYLQAADPIDRDDFLTCLIKLDVTPFRFTPLPEKIPTEAINLASNVGEVIDNLIIKLSANNVEKRDTSSWMFKWKIKNETLSDKRINLTDDIIRELRILKQQSKKDPAIVQQQVIALLDQAIDFNNQLTNEHSRVRCGWKIDGAGSLDKLLREEKESITRNIHHPALF